MATQLSMLPQGVAADPLGLVSAINDRLHAVSTFSSARPPRTPQPRVRPPAPPGCSPARGRRLGSPVPPNGSLYIETDHTNLIYLVQASAWQYFSGHLQSGTGESGGVRSHAGRARHRLAGADNRLRACLSGLAFTGSGATATRNTPTASTTLARPRLNLTGGTLATGRPECPFLNYAGGLGTRDLPNTNTNPAYTHWLRASTRRSSRRRRFPPSLWNRFRTRRTCSKPETGLP